MITFKTIKDHIILSLGGYPSLAPEQTRDERLAEIVNNAGEYLYSNPWNFRNTTSRLLNTVLNQPFIQLDADVGEIVSILGSTAYGSRIDLITKYEMDLHRLGSGTVSSVGVSFACVSASPLTAGSANQTNRLELYPTPSDSTVGAITIRCSVVFPNVSAISDDTFVLSMPVYVQNLFIAYCKAFAISYEIENLSAMLIQIDQGPLMDQARRKDGLQQQSFGVLRRSVDIRGSSMPISFGVIPDP